MTSYNSLNHCSPILTIPCSMQWSIPHSNTHLVLHSRYVFVHVLFLIACFWVLAAESCVSLCEPPPPLLLDVMNMCQLKLSNTICIYTTKTLSHPPISASLPPHHVCFRPYCHIIVQIVFPSQHCFVRVWLKCPRGRTARFTDRRVSQSMMRSGCSVCRELSMTEAITSLLGESEGVWS